MHDSNMMQYIKATTNSIFFLLYNSHDIVLAFNDIKISLLYQYK